MVDIDTTHQNEFVSTGHLCQLLQRSPHQIRTAASALGIVPSLTINDVKHFNSADVDRLAEHFRNEGR